MSTAVSVVPSNLQLPAHLQSPDIAASIAAANAAAAGGVRAGGFPTISIKSNHFHIKDGDETVTLMVPPSAPGQPALPMMCLEVVIVDANPALSHTFFEGEYVEGENVEPSCRSGNGITPDADVAAKQSVACATCPQYAWGSKISKLTGKPVRACGDSKQLAVVPANDLAYKMLGLQIKAGSLKNWGTYIQALSGRGYGVSTLVTNITFDQSANGVLQFSFNRFLSEAEYIKVNERKTGDDVKLIIAQSRALAPAAALAAPVNLGLPAPEVAPPTHMAPPASATAPATGFGAGVTTAPAYQAGQAAANATVAAQAAAANIAPAAPSATDPFAGLEPHVQMAVAAVGGLETHAGQRTYQALTGVDFMALIAAMPPTTAAAPAATPAPAEPPKRSRRTRAEMEAAKAPAADPHPESIVPNLSHIPADIMATINAVGATSAAGQALIAAYPPPQATAPVTSATPQATPAAAPPSPAAPPAAVATTTGFGAAPAAPIQQAPTAQVVASGASLAEKLRAKLGLAAGA
ncbi:MAG: hypothetical protein PHW66_09715 [Gallionella sp.]|nr:hypothetical protein [Gallionella sp.]